MLQSQYNSLTPDLKHVYFEAASNAVLKQMLDAEIKDVESQMLVLEKRTDENDTDFRRRFDNLQQRRKLLNEFLEINFDVITFVQKPRQ